MVIGKSRTNQPVEDTDGAVAGLVEEMVESGDLDNAKPLYFHPITIVRGTTEERYYSISCIIINNDDTAYDTWSKFFNAVKSIAGSLPDGATARFPATGAIISDNKLVCASTLEMTKANQNVLLCYGYNTSNQQVNIDLNTYTPRVFDGVNKIN